MKTKAVHFDEDGYARIFINPSPELLALPRTLVDPDLSSVGDMPPEFWKLSGDKIVPMAGEERDAREKDAMDGSTAGFTSTVVRTVERTIIKVPAWAYAVMVAEAVALVVTLLVHKF